jgi:hypothetical protein
MHRVSINRAVLLAAGLAAIALAAVVAASSRGQGTGPPGQGNANGGATQWVASDPSGGHLNLMTYKALYLVNTSTEANSFTVTYERSQLRRVRSTVCRGTLQRGERRLCTLHRPDHNFQAGYFLVRSSRPLIPSGWVQYAAQGMEERTERVRGQVRGTGEFRPSGPWTIQRVTLDWQQGCPPREDSGCPGAGGSGVIAP